METSWALRFKPLYLVKALEHSCFPTQVSNVSWNFKRSSMPHCLWISSFLWAGAGALFSWHFTSQHQAGLICIYLEAPWQAFSVGRRREKSSVPAKIWLPCVVTTFSCVCVQESDVDAHTHSLLLSRLLIRQDSILQAKLEPLTR